jgi:putative transposase
MTTYTELTYQLVFGGKSHHKFIPEDHQEELFSYLGGALKSLDCMPLIQGGHIDHVHLVFQPSVKISLSKIVQEVKKASNSFLKSRLNDFPDFDSWQVGYGGFSYRKAEREKLINYVKGQKEHHKKVSFEEEYIRLLMEYGIDFDPKYLFI